MHELLQFRAFSDFYSAPAICVSMEKRGYRYLEHMSDAYIECWGSSVEEALEEAGRGMFNLISSMEASSPRLRVRATVRGFDMQSLLYNWLERLIQIFEIREFLPSRISVRDFDEDKSGLKVRAELRGERFSLDRHPAGIGVKSVTYHAMQIRRKKGRVMFRFLLDI